MVVLTWLIEVNRALRGIRIKAQDALRLLDDSKGEDEEGASAGIEQVKKYMQDDLDRLLNLVEERLSSKALNNLRRHVHFGHEVDFRDILTWDLPELEQDIETYALSRREKLLDRQIHEQREIGIEHLIHPVIRQAAWEQYEDGHLRDAVLNAFIAVFDQIRERTGLTLDGDALATQTFSVHDPYLVLSQVEDESGKSDQVGFMQIFQGAYRGIRNPKAHSLGHDLTDLKAAQYLVFASLLARRVHDARLVGKPPVGGGDGTAA